MMEWVIAVVAGIAGLAAIWFGGKKAGVSSIKAKQNEARLEAVNEANEVRNEVEALDRDTLKRRAAKWVRGSRK